MASVSGIEWGRGERMWGEVRSERIQFIRDLVGCREEFGSHSRSRGFPSGSAIKNPPALQETQEMWVWSLGWKDHLKRGLKTHSSILALAIPRTEEPGRLQSTGPKRVWLHLATEHTNILKAMGYHWRVWSLDCKVFFWTMLKSLDFVQKTGTHQRFKSLGVSGLESHFLNSTWAEVKVTA